MSSAKRKRPKSTTEKWIDAHWHRLIRAARPYEDGVVTAEDIVMVALWNAYEKRAKLKSPDAVGSWLEGFVRLTGLKHVDQRQARQDLMTLIAPLLDHKQEPQPDAFLGDGPGDQHAAGAATLGGSDASANDTSPDLAATFHVVRGTMGQEGTRANLSKETEMRKPGQQKTEATRRGCAWRWLAWAVVYTAMAAHEAMAATAIGALPVAAQSAGPTLILEDSVILQETDEVFLGQPMEMFVGEDGSLFVMDAYASAVVRFDRAGRPIRAFGNKGGGPGEFAHLGMGGFATSRVLGVTDGMPPRQEIELFDLKSGEHLGQVLSSGSVTALAAHDGRLWAGAIDPERRKTLAVEPLRALLRGGRPSILPKLVEIPRPYVANEIIMGMLGVVRLHVEDDHLLMGFAGSPFVLRVAPDGEVLDTVPLLATTRRGVPDEDKFIEMMQPGEGSYEDLFGLASILLSLSGGDGYIFTVHADGELEGQQVSGRIYASSLREDGTEQCPTLWFPRPMWGGP